MGPRTSMGVSENRKIFALSGIPIPGRPIRSLLATPTSLSRLLNDANNEMEIMKGSNWNTNDDNILDFA